MVRSPLYSCLQIPEIWLYGFVYGAGDDDLGSLVSAVLGVVDVIPVQGVCH